MSRVSLIGLALIGLLFTGCRREDIREFTVEMPELKASDQSQVVAALAPYAGVQKDSFVWDFNAKTLKLKYDSMQIARTNIRMAIEQAGVKVVYPVNTTGKAGY